MEKKYVIGCDGFIQYEDKLNLEDAIVRWNNTIRNSLLYQYDVSVYEVDDNDKILRRLSFEEVYRKTV